MSQHEVYELLSDLDKIEEKLAGVREKAQHGPEAATVSQDLQRLFLLCSSNLNELEKTASRLRNELTETYTAANEKLNGEQ